MTVQFLQQNWNNPVKNSPARKKYIYFERKTRAKSIVVDICLKAEFRQPI